MATKKNSVTYKVVNTDPGVTVPVVTKTVESSIRDGKVTLAKDFQQALKFAIQALWEFLQANGQYKASVVEIEGVTIPDNFTRVLKSPDYARYNNAFPLLFTHVYTEIVARNPEKGVEFLRSTDRGQVFKSVKDSAITQEIVAAQVVEFRNMVKFAVKLRREDARDSVWDESLLKRKQAIADKKKAERLLLKAAK